MNEAIRLYIEAQFQTLPETPEVARAKQELLQMSEDKYGELLASGVSENEATGRVITEFGNLNELADELGIRHALNTSAAEYPHVAEAEAAPDLPVLTREEAEQALADNRRASIFIAAGVAIILLGVIANILLSGGLSFKLFASPGVVRADANLGFIPLIGVAIAVPIFIMSVATNRRFRKLDEGKAIVGYDTGKHYKAKLDEAEPRYYAGIATGVGLILLGIVVAAMSPSFGISVLIGVTLAVPLLIINGMRRSALNVLSLAGPQFARKRAARVDSESKIGVLASVYWPITLVVFLLWSFLGNAWHISWVVWPVAGFMFGAIVAVIEARTRKSHNIN